MFQHPHVSPMNRFLFPNSQNIPFNQPFPFGNGFMNQHPLNQFPFNMMKMNQAPAQNFAPNPFFNPYQNQYPNLNYNQYPMHQPMPMGQSILNQFKTQEGKLDFNKIINTSGQMMGTVNQISSIVKGLSSTFKGF